MVTVSFNTIKVVFLFFTHGENKRILLALNIILRVLELMNRSYWLFLLVTEPAERL